MKTVKVGGSIAGWIMRPENHLFKQDGGYILNSGYFSGDNIPEKLQELLSSYYQKFGSIQIFFVTP